ncbi:P-loop containing nucleoside triphosphate hydrolase protein [Pseudoneurospora amorphoporcata]|uniref:ATP-dependent RNA helicase n=1 Tax=Pseudoneurospora amorphoporcata TaxID=241081 RepID=A0AAN6NT24_9PEZI|nr:P-loop containing nucleoside triphosphate hydrolase protein [Pseudoneurospora amorphoporcata]
MAVDKKRKNTKGPASGPKRRKTQQQSKQTKRPVSVDALAWKTVDIPEMFDDAEGFFGLEEITGVDVVKEGDVVKFMAAVPKSKAEVEDDGEEFDGFDDEETPKPVENVDQEVETSDSKAETVKTPAKEKKAPKDQKKPKEQPKEQQKQKKQQPNKAANKKASEDKKKARKNEKTTVEPKDPELETDLFTKLEELPEPEEEEVDMSEWVPLDLSPQMVSSIAKLKFTKPTVIQAQAIPQIMAGHDVIGKASTGSGKTLSFGIPVVEAWLSAAETRKQNKEEKKGATALILSPTRELAQQIRDHLQALCKGLPTAPYICSVLGGMAVQKQKRQLQVADIVIATPGRMWEVMSSDNSVLASLRNISFLVLDEADRLLKDGSFKEAEEIFKALDRQAVEENNEDQKMGNTDEERQEEEEEESEEGEEEEEEEEEPVNKRQTLVFSATFNKNLQQKLAGKSRFKATSTQDMEYLLQKLNFRETPKFVDANPVHQMAENLKEGLIMCGDMEKDLYLYATLMLQPTRRALVFTNSVNSVRRLTPLLENLNLPAFPLHSGMIQQARLRSIDRFKANEGAKKKNGSAAILVATDVAARGLDIPEVDLVIHYHVPRAAEDYVHRSGRTARASNSGTSILLCGPKEAVPTQRLVAKVHAQAEVKAGNSGNNAKKLVSSGLRTIDIDRRIVAKLRERVDLAKKIADAVQAKTMGGKEDDWMKKAAEDLGVEYDSEELEKAGKWAGKGSLKKQKQKEAQQMSKGELASLRAALRDLLGKRINTGVSERYLTGLDVNELLKGEQGLFLGKVDGLGLDD